MQQQTIVASPTTFDKGISEYSTRMSTNNKRDMDAFEEDDEFEEDYKDRSSSNDTLLRKIRMLCQRCIENERLIKRHKMELRLSKSTARQTKRQIRNDYN